MAFSQTAISNVTITPIASLAVIRVAWNSSADAGTTYQVYANKVLAWYGTDLKAEMPWPKESVHYEVGTVGPGEGQIDFSGSLPSQPPQGKAVLSWRGGRYLDPASHNITGFHVYGETTPGGGINYSTPLATVQAQQGPISQDGFGGGGFGGGGFGYAEVDYSWTSKKLARTGTWNFGVKSFGTSGNESTVLTVAVYVLVPPNPPLPFSTGKRLTYTYSSTTHKVTLNWNANQ